MSTDSLLTAEGYAPIYIDKLDIREPYKTYYKVIGDLANTTIPPLIVLHGGPGTGHEYMLPFAQLWPRYNIPVIFFDGIGCAKSDHFPEQAGNHSFWTEELFVSQLDWLIRHFKLHEGRGFNLLGHSFGGNIAAAFAATPRLSRPEGLKKLVLASALASKELSTKSVMVWKAQMPVECQKAMDEAERTGDWDSKEYQEAMALFRKRHLIRAEKMPEELLPGLKHLSEDRTLHESVQGKSYKLNTGSFANWTVIPRLHQIEVPTLVYNGEFDTSHDVSQVPFFELIPRVRWYSFAGRGHMCHLEEESRERCLRLVGDFLAQKEG